MRKCRRTSIYRKVNKVWIGIILAGDGNVDACIQFDNRKRAERAMAEILERHFDPTYDRVLIEAPQHLEEFVKEQKEMEEENAQYEAEYKMSANAVDGLDDGMDKFH